MGDAESTVPVAPGEAPRSRGADAPRARGADALRARVLVAVLVLVALAGPRSARAADEPVAAPVPAEVLARAASPDAPARVGALVSLRALATPAAFQLALVMLQRDLDPRVRAWAAVALGGSRDPAFEAPLAWAASADPDPYVRSAATAARAAVAPFAKRPKVAAGFSVLCPGCGYFYLDEPARAWAFLGTAAGLFVAGGVVLEATPPGSDGTVHDPGRSMPLFGALQDLWFYGVFASYRDARLARGDAGARYPVAKESLPELLFAPFNPRVLKSPWVWAGVPAMLGAGVAASYILTSATSTSPADAMRTLADGGGVKFFGHHYSTGPGVALGETYHASLYLPVAVGEEALFRGALQAGLSETSLGLWGGWAVGSAIFGAAHTFNYIFESNGVEKAALAVPYLTVTGSYLGYVYIRSNFSLLEGVALHFWYDFLLATIDFVVDPDHQPFVASFAIPL
jgi:membrane protease YdiL (CAAX protease family)